MEKWYTHGAKIGDTWYITHLIRYDFPESGSLQISDGTIANFYPVFIETFVGNGISGDIFQRVSTPEEITVAKWESYVQFLADSLPKFDWRKLYDDRKRGFVDENNPSAFSWRKPIGDEIHGLLENQLLMIHVDVYPPSENRLMWELKSASFVSGKYRHWQPFLIGGWQTLEEAAAALKEKISRTHGSYLIS